MALDIHNVIRRPVLTEKSTELINDKHQITFLVDPQANKPMVKEALEKLFGVKVKAVNIKVRKGKNRIFKRVKSKGVLTKQAIVTLKDSQSFDILAGLVSGGLVSSKSATPSAPETSRE